MCGILLVYGDNPKNLLSHISKLVHRGPDDKGEYINKKMGMAFTRLAITDETVLGKQPHETKKFLSMINGEIYNFEQLVKEYDLKIIGKSDTQIVGLLFETLGFKIIEVLDGFYSGILFNKESNKLYTIKDYIGKKGLFLVKKGQCKIITSELKAIPDYDSFDVVPKGVCEIDIRSWEIIKQVSHKYTSKRPEPLLEILTQAVRKRIPKNGSTCGVFISGGLDSSIIASLVSTESDNIKYYLLANKESDDYQYALKLAGYLNIKLKIIPLPILEEIPSLIVKIVRITESYNPSIISNGICSYLLSEAAKNDGLKVILSGEGADELFGGYKYFHKEELWLEHRNELLENMYLTELRRLDLTCMANSIEARLPYLDQKVYSLVKELKYDDFYQQIDNIFINKYILRGCIKDNLPSDIIWRKKVSFDVGSGVRKLVVKHLQEKYGNEKEGLLTIWRSIYTSNPNHDYFHSYPTFDKAISKRGFAHK